MLKITNKPCVKETSEIKKHYQYKYTGKNLVPNSSREVRSNNSNSFTLHKDHKYNPLLKQANQLNQTNKSNQMNKINKTVNNNDNSCLCFEIQNTDNIIFNKNVCKLCGESKLETKSNIDNLESKENKENVTHHKTKSLSKNKNDIGYKERLDDLSFDSQTFQENQTKYKSVYGSFQGKQPRKINIFSK